MQGIEFQIVNDSAEASRGLDELAKSLANLKTSLGTGVSAVSRLASSIKRLRDALDGIDTKGIGTKLKGLSGALANFNVPNTAKISSALPKNITSLNTAVSGVNSDKLNALASGLSAIGAATESLSISSSIGNQIQNIANAVTAIPDSTSQKLNDLATSLKPLTELGKQQIGPFITQLKKIPELVTELETVDMSKFKQQMEDLANAMKPFADEMQKVSSGFSAFPSRIQRLITSTERYNNTVRNATNHTTAWGNALKKISLAAIFRSGYKLLASAINKSSEYTETLNMFTVSMGEYAQQAYDYAQTVSEVLGIDPSTWMENQGVFNSIITGFGVASDKAYTMSKNLTQLAYDLSSFYNIGIEESMQKVQSGISGELEPLRRLGYDLSVARLQQEALNLGIEKSVSDMTQAEKAQLRYHAMLTQVTQVQGDMARTLQEPANQLRVLKAQVEQAARAFGNIFIPILNAVLPVCIAIASAIREIVSAIAALFGIEMADSVDWGDSIGSAAGATGDIAGNMDSAAGSAKELKKSLAGFDELNVLTSQSSSSGGSGFDIDPIDYDFLSGAVTDQIDKIKAKLEPVINWIKENIESILKAAVDIGAAILAWEISSKILSGLKKIIKYFKTGSKELDGWGKASKIISGAIMITLGAKWSYDAGFEIGKGTAAFTDYVKAVLGPVAAGVGGALIGSVVPGIGTGIGFAIGVGIGVIFEIAGYFEGKEAANVVEAFSSAVTNGKVPIEEFASTAAGAFDKLSAVSSKVSSYGTQIQEQNSKIEEAKLAVDNYMAVWSATGEITTSEIGGIIDNLQLLLDASQEKLSLASTALTTTLTQALKGAGEEATKTYNGLLSMVYLLESNGNSTIAGWKMELAEAETALSNLDETSSTYSKDSAELVDRIGELLGKIYGFGDSTNSVTSNLSELNATINGLDFSSMVNGPEVATDALTKLSSSATEAYTNAKTAFQTNMDALNELFSYVDTESPRWQAIYNEALDMGLDPSTDFTDVEAVKTFMQGYFKEIYESNLTEIDNLYKDSYGVIAQYMEDAIESAAAETTEGKTAAMSQDDWAQLIYGTDYESLGGINNEEVTAEIGEQMNAALAAGCEEAANHLKEDETWGPLFDALEDSIGSVESARALTNIGTGMGEPLVSGISEGLTNPVAQGLLDAGFENLAGLIDKYGKNAMDIHSPAGLTVPHGEYLTSGVAKGLVDKTSRDTIKGAVEELADMLDDSFEEEFGVGTNNALFYVKGKSIIQDFSDGISNNIDIARNAMNNFLNVLISKMETFTNRCREAINLMLSDISTAMANTSVGSNGEVSVPTIKTRSINRFASGGFPDTGQLFIAREAGAEMVGSIGGKTAVANNDQIVEAVALGVYQAVSQAMAEGENSTTITLDGDVLYKAVVRKDRQHTKRAGVSAFAY